MRTAEKIVLVLLFMHKPMRGVFEEKPEYYSAKMYF